MPCSMILIVCPLDLSDYMVLWQEQRSEVSAEVALCLP